MASSASSSPEHDPQSWTSPFEELLADAAQDHGLGDRAAHRPDPTFGTPNGDVTWWEGQQHLQDDCAIKCQQFILEQFTGQRIAEETLVREAQEHGWYAPGNGTTIPDVGNLLELHGVGVTRYEHASQFHLAHELAQGHKVIVGVESESLWHHDPFLHELRELLGIHGAADHAVVVSGIDTSDPQHVRVLVSDPGTGQPLATYPLEQFLDAWRGSDFYMVATTQPCPAHLPEMAHFDYGLGHIHEIAGQSYEHFLDSADHPAHWADVVHHYVEDHPPADGPHGHHDLPGAEHAFGHGAEHPLGHGLDPHGWHPDQDLWTDPHHHPTNGSPEDVPGAADVADHHHGGHAPHDGW